MKKKFAVMVVIVSAIIAGYNVYSLPVEEKISDLLLSNVEALADHGETSPGYRKGYIASSYQYYLPGYGYTTIPCCRYTGNEYSACSAIDICP
ncbi:NVEALA domain-containing protein [Bacteroides congonensis]|uniref:NVEALA domain-containing protein n=1 Tax=Bacteroides congonensis TaxID=1871006 RepID=UPI0018A047FC|nr:NVEALA domain-containing protein [Bacteroides congonensis]